MGSLTSIKLCALVLSEPILREIVNRSWTMAVDSGVGVPAESTSLPVAIATGLNYGLRIHELRKG